MAFKRALWHSGLTYKQTCDTCHTPIEYTDFSLDFRPWFADGFVYCPKCKKPLRHRETYAIDADNLPKETYTLHPGNPATTNGAPSAPDEGNPEATDRVGITKFCSQCGKPFFDNDMFCSACGNKRS